MQYRTLGRTGLRVSELGFGCGAVGGLLVRGDYREMVRVVARAMEAGITYFDTARSYGDGASESNLGRVLDELRVNGAAADVIVGTKVQLTSAEMANIADSITTSVDGSLRRLQREQLDLIQLHNSIAGQRQSNRAWVTVEDIGVALRTFEKLQQQGKVRFWGINGLGETPAIHQALAMGTPHTIQSCYNLLNPSAGMVAPANFPFQDYKQLIQRAAAQETGVIAIRVLAAGALSGTTERHANAAQAVAPIATSDEFSADVDRAHAFDFLVEEGYASSLVAAAIRFAISNPKISTALVGISNLDQLETAIAAAEAGPLPSAALDNLPAIWRTFGAG